MSNNPKGPVRTRFETLDFRRKVMLFRYQEYSELSIPGLYPRDGSNETSELPVPFASATGRNVTRLSSRVTSTLVPLNGMPFFELELDEAEPIEGEDPTEEQKVLSRLERRITSKISGTNFRAALNLGIQHAEVTGNGCFIVNDNYSFTLLRVDQFVIRRRPDGEWHEIIFRQWIDPSMLPEEIKKAGFAESDDLNGKPSDPSDALYTKVVNDHKGGCTIEREYKGKVIPSKGDGVYKVCPYVPFGWMPISGENYYRGLIEDNLGDVRALEVMAEALLDSIAANAEYRFGVNPAGITEIHDLQNSSNGAFVPASKDDVFPITLANQAQVVAAQASVTAKEQTLGQVFLSSSSVMRDAERVTLGEIRIRAAELEQALAGGVFSGLARDILIPVVRRILFMMLRDKLLVSDDATTQALIRELTEADGVLKIKIKTGLEALAREAEHEKMNVIMDKLVAIPEPGQRAVNWTGTLNRWISTAGVESTGMIYSEAEMQARDAAAQQAEMQAAAQQGAIDTAGAVAQQAAAQPQ